MDRCISLLEPSGFPGLKDEIMFVIVLLIRDRGRGDNQEL